MSPAIQQIRKRGEELLKQIRATQDLLFYGRKKPAGEEEVVAIPKQDFEQLLQEELELRKISNEAFAELVDRVKRERETLEMAHARKLDEDPTRLDDGYTEAWRLLGQHLVKEYGSLIAIAASNKAEEE